ncbi:antitoxin AF2212-like protein [Parapedobacter soli]|uniref:antitoxin AF2212-like protein n=1 Tax=Parapedobacter soli TaxID=416955 RepID=UPI0021C603C8|nr:antitoxin AF2212-like protein [Parapedobacter soli]
MYTAIKGVYENGVLRLLEPVRGIKKADVVITFLNEERLNSKKVRKPGGLLRLQHHKGKLLDIPEDFNDPIEDMKDYM